MYCNAEFARSPPSSPLKEIEARESGEESDDEAVLDYCNADGDYPQGMPLSSLRLKYCTHTISIRIETQNTRRNWLKCLWRFDRHLQLCDIT